MRTDSDYCDGLAESIGKRTAPALAACDGLTESARMWDIASGMPLETEKKGGEVRRPKSLRETAEESATYSDFGYNLKDFLHAFAEARRKQLPLAPMLAEQPPRLAQRFAEGNICDAFLAGTADYLSRVNGIPTPLWALKEDLVLEKPWFSEEMLSVRMRLLRDTPSAFKDKNIFVFESALSVA